MSQEISESENRTPDDIKNNEKPNTHAPTKQAPELQKSRPVRNWKVLYEWTPMWQNDIVWFNKRMV